QAVAAARAGSQVAFVGRVGRDDEGDQVRQSLDTSGVDTGYLAVDDRLHTGRAMITVDQRGENIIVVVAGANGAVSTGQVSEAQKVISASRVVVSQLEIPFEAADAAMHRGAEAAAITVLNPSPARPLPDEILRAIDVLVLNSQELVVLGPTLGGPEAARQLLAQGVGAVVVTMGGDGALLVTESNTERIPAWPVEPVDTTGAGDAFVGNLAHALDDEQSLPDAIRFATAAAALSVQVRGAQPSSPTLQQTAAFLAKQAQ
ncbi:MAG: ribokinase, partial [Chloroflexota bacterium]